MHEYILYLMNVALFMPSGVIEILGAPCKQFYGGPPTQ